MRPTKENFDEWNETNAIKYDLDKFYNHPNRLFRYIENKRIKTLIEVAEIGNESTVLDLGCGAGHILEKISCGILTGIDASETQIKRAAAKLRDSIVLIRAHGENLPFEDGHFDRVICSEVLEHVLEPEILLNEMNRILKVDGIISLSIPNEKLIILTKKILLRIGLKRILIPKGSGWDLAAKNNLDEWHLHEFSLKLIQQLLAGLFLTEELRKIPSAVFPYRYVLKLRKITSNQRN